MRRAAFLMLMTLTAFAAGCGKKPGPEGGGSTGDPDLDRLQGVWAVEKYEAGEPDQAPSTDDIRDMRFSFEGKQLRVKSANFSVVLDRASNPNVMIVSRLDDDGKPRDRMEWIYKFDGDVLVVANAGREGKRPTAFVPKRAVGERGPVIGGDPGKPNTYVPPVDVIRLKKTDEKPPPSEPPAKRPTGTRPKGK